MIKQLRDRPGWEVVQFMATLLVPILTGVIGWNVRTLVDHEVRISTIESNRFTSSEAMDFRREIMSQFPPAWFRDKVDTIQKTQGELQKEVSSLRAAVERLAAKIE